MGLLDPPAYSRTAADAKFGQVVLHGSNASTPRPQGATFVQWVGTVLPVNMTATDLFINLTVVTDTNAPSSPAAMQANMSGANVVLTWGSATDDTGVTSYKVHRSSTAGFTIGSGTVIGTVTGLTFTDTSPLSGPAYYKVVALDAAGNTSAPSTEVSPFNPFGIGVTWHAAVWADMETTLGNGDALTTILDRSGNTRHFSEIGSAPVYQATDSLLNNRPVYLFDGVDDYARTGTAFTAVTLPYTLVIVAERTRKAAGVAYAIAGGQNNSTTQAGTLQGSGSNHLHNINAGVDLSSGRTDDVFLIIATDNGTTSTIDVNNHLVSGTAGNTNQPTKWMIANKVGLSYFNSQRVAFCGFIAGTLTTNQITALRAGVVHHYGIPQ